MLLHVEEPEFAGPDGCLKGAVDRTLAALALLLAAPLLLAVAVAIRLDSARPVLYRRTRVCKDGRPFTLVKFHSMHPDSDRRRAELAVANEAADGRWSYA